MLFNTDREADCSRDLECRMSSSDFLKWEEFSLSSFLVLLMEKSENEAEGNEKK